MTKYRELQIAVNQLDIAQEHYWAQLEDIYQQLPYAFLEFLGLEKNSALDLYNREVPVISLGNLHDNEIITTHPRQLEKEGKSLKFTLRLALSDESGLVRLPLNFEIKMSRTMSNIIFDINGFKEHIICKRDDDNLTVDFNPLLETIFNFITTKLSPAKYL